MFGVGRIGSYISRGVYTVSGPFHPVGGAVDIIVVEQPDGSLKSSPWYVRFGKFQGVLKADERIVRINVNGIDADFHMHLDDRGEVYFGDMDCAEGESEMYFSLGDEEEVKSDICIPSKSQSCNFDADLVSELEGSDKKIVPRTNSPRRSYFGLPIGRRSMKENGHCEEEGAVGAEGATLLERAEIAADLLEVRWTTNLKTTKNGNADSLKKPRSTLPSDEMALKDPSIKGHAKNEVNFSTSDIGNVACKVPSSQHSEGTDVGTSCSKMSENYLATSNPQETCIQVDIDPVNSDKDAHSNFFRDTEQNEGCLSLIEEHSNTGIVMNGGNAMEIENKIVESSVCLDTASPLATFNGQSDDNLLTVEKSYKEPKDQNSDKCCETEFDIPASEMDKNDGSSQDGISNGNEKSLCNVAEEISTGTNLTPVETRICVGDTNNEPRSEDYYSCTLDFKSVPVVSGIQSSNDDMGRQPLSLGATKWLRNSSHGKITNVDSSGNSEEQFSFSDLDDTKVEKGEGTTSSSIDGGKECLLQHSEESSEEELSEATISGDESNLRTIKPLKNDLHVSCPVPEVKPNSASSPINISKAYKVGDVEFLTPLAESLPNMPFSGDNINPYGIPEPTSRSLDSNFEALKTVNKDAQVFPESGAEQQVADEHLKDSSMMSEEIRKIVSDPAVEISLCRDLLFEGMGYEAAAVAFDSEKLETDKFCALCPDILKDDKLVVRIGGLYFPWDAALPVASRIGTQGKDQILEPNGMIAVGVGDKRSEVSSSKPMMNSRSGSWRYWPFSRRSSSKKERDLDSVTIPESPIKNNKSEDVNQTKFVKKKSWAKSPTCEQLTSLNLKEGKNAVTFTFFNQQVDARIFLWKWKTRIVISDVDGTITKSDVLGQFMPLMGLDWSHTGVAHLFSAIKENGYNLLFLSARSILQAHHTRQFLVNLKQEGKALPEGPIVISPDGLFPSLYREVIRRAPHEFKISCLEVIKALFPPDHNPFYAGFGNRHTDELSYLRVGIPKGKIFTINPKSQVVVNRRVDSKSYSSLHSLVHNMFPPTSETEQEDYNSWNFWRLPPPDVCV